METLTQLDLFADTTETVEVVAPPTLADLIGQGGPLWNVIGQAALSRNYADQDWSQAWAAGYRSNPAGINIPDAAQEPYLSYLGNAQASEAYRHSALLVAQALGVTMERNELHRAIVDATIAFSARIA